jgi:hypothetical protein
MAVTGEVQIGRINRFLTKWLGSKGSSPRMTIGGEIVPVLPLWSGAENRWLESWDKFGFFAFVAAVAAVNSRFRIRNPAGSKVIIVVEALIAVPAAADTIVLQEARGIATDLATTFNATPLDARNPRKSAVITSIGTSATDMAGQSSVFDSAAPASLPAIFINTINQEFPITPGDTYEMKANTVNNACTFSMFYRERALEDSETQ